MAQGRNGGLIIPGILLPNTRRLRGGKNLDGSLWLEMDGGERINMPPAAAFEMACGILKALGCEVNYTPAAVAKAT